jgi:hypothetical protein
MSLDTKSLKFAIIFRMHICQHFVVNFTTDTKCVKVSVHVSQLLIQN